MSLVLVSLIFLLLLINALYTFVLTRAIYISSCQSYTVRAGGQNCFGGKKWRARVDSGNPSCSNTKAVNQMKHTLLKWRAKSIENRTESRKRIKGRRWDRATEERGKSCLMLSGTPECHFLSETHTFASSK